MNLNQIQNVYFIGIGGIGMSALARYFKFIGKQVSGYDKTPSMLTNELIESGIDSCKVGFLPRFMMPRAPIFDGAVAQVVQMYGPDDTNKHVRKRWMTMKGYCRAVLLTVMSPLGSTCPMADYINPEYKRGDTAGPKRKRDNCPDEHSI